MMARGIAVALGGGQREGHNYRAPCPLHNGNSLALADGHDRKLLVHCFGGCEWRDIFAELRALGLLEGETRSDPEREEERRRRAADGAKAEIEKLRQKISRARDLYRRGKPAAGPPVQIYLETRNIVGQIPDVL